MSDDPKDDCLHTVVPEPAFDKEAAKDLDVQEICKRWPRFDGACPTCGCQLIKYASFEHYTYGDW